jgi:hypothetical protein
MVFCLGRKAFHPKVEFVEVADTIFTLIDYLNPVLLLLLDYFQNFQDLFDISKIIHHTLLIKMKGYLPRVQDQPARRV